MDTPPSPLPAGQETDRGPVLAPGPEATPSLAATAADVRSLWEASQALLASQPGGHLVARALLHLEALRLAREAMGVDGWATHLRQVETRLGSPAALLSTSSASLCAKTVTLGQLALLELVHEATLAELEHERRLAEKLRERRWLRAGAALCLVGLAAVGVTQGFARWRAPVDLARGKPWTTSSTQVACVPEEGRCGQERMPVFFVTREEMKPWFRIDLGGAVTFSSLTVLNRSDMLLERAVPLVVEVSDDLETWRELARQTAVFTRWDPSFTPVTARYVRLRVDRFAALHLERVEVHP